MKLRLETKNEVGGLELLVSSPRERQLEGFLLPSRPTGQGVRQYQSQSDLDNIAHMYLIMRIEPWLDETSTLQRPHKVRVLMNFL